LRLYCPKNGAPAIQPRKCGWAECEVVITPRPSSPAQRFCSKACWRKSEHFKRAALWQKHKVEGRHQGVSEEEKRAAEMEPMVKRLEAVRLAADAYVPLMGEELRLATVRLMGGAA
jgi:hypothetical protein